MYSFVGWIELDTGDDDIKHLDRAVDQLNAFLKTLGWKFNDFATVHAANGTFRLILSGDHNRPRTTTDELDGILDYVATRLPGSHGLVFERDDERTIAPGRNAYRLRVMVRGNLTELPDPFFTPLEPTIRDPFSPQD